MAAILRRFCELPKEAVSGSTAQTAYDRASAYLTAAVSAPRYGSLGGEWTVLALARGGADTETAYFTDYYAALEQTVREANGVLSASTLSTAASFSRSPRSGRTRGTSRALI